MADSERAGWAVRVVAVVVVLAGVLLGGCTGQENTSTMRPAQTAIPAPPIAIDQNLLTLAERAYLQQIGPVKMCVDPDWEPYERINEAGEHEGIAADLLRTVAARSGVTLELVKTATWDETIEIAHAGQCHILSFLNQTP